MLAKELSADLVLLDERRARSYARSEGLNVIGCVGILETLYRRGHLLDLRSAYSGLLIQGFRIDRGALEESLVRMGLPRL
jgi:predicted nucleic acid-binding protein